MEQNRAKWKASANVPSTVEDTRQSQHQERLEKIRERKIQQLRYVEIFSPLITLIRRNTFFRAYNVPERYLKEIEKKCHQMAKSRFTLSYFGKK